VTFSLSLWRSLVVCRPSTSKNSSIAVAKVWSLISLSEVSQVQKTPRNQSPCTYPYALHTPHCSPLSSLVAVLHCTAKVVTLSLSLPLARFLKLVKAQDEARSDRVPATVYVYDRAVYRASTSFVRGCSKLSKVVSHKPCKHYRVL
jgi:hypothetical protein